MSISYLDAASVTKTLEEEAGDVGGTTRAVHGLPDDVKATLEDIEIATEAVAALISAAKLAVADSAVASALSSVNTALGVPAGGPKFGQDDDIDTGSDTTFGSQALTRGMYIKNISTAGQVLYLSHSATPTSTNSFHLLAGETSPFIECSNANVVFMRPSANNAAACYVGA